MSKFSFNAAAKEWVPPSQQSSPSTASASSTTPQTNNNNSTTGLRSTAQEFVPTSSQTTPIQQPMFQPMYVPSYPYFYPQSYYDPSMMMPGYDPMLVYQLQQPQYHQPQAQHYEGHKSRSNSVTHQSEVNSSVPSKVSGGSLATKSDEVVESIKSPEGVQSTSVVESVSEVQSPQNESTESIPVTESGAVAGNNIETELKTEQESGWERGKALIVEVPGKQPAENSVPEAGPSPWKRGISMPEKTPAQMLLRQDEIIRYSREMIISLHVSGSNSVPDVLLALYGTKYTSTERRECKPVSGPAPKSPNKGRREKGRRDEVIEEPHPDEKTFFHAKSDGVFRYDPNRVLDTHAPDAVIHKATEILNKLSVESFERLSDQFLNIGMETEEIMGRVVDLIVSKAQMEEHFCFMYAELCKKITDKWVSEEVTEDQVAVTQNTSSAPDLGKAFRCRLLNRCQEEFQQDREAAMQAIMKLEIPEEDKEEKLFVLKKRYIGHMRFVGEIYMKELLKPTKVYLCIEDLLESRDEEKLACLCKLMQTIGSKLETYDQKKKKKFPVYFEKIAQLGNDKQLSTKVRFGFKDLIELRNNNWVARRTEEKAKKLSEIRLEAAAPTPTNQGPPSRSRPAPSPQDVRAAAPTDWNVVPQKGKKGAAPTARAPVSKNNAPSSVPTTNKFSALNSATPSNRGGKVKNRYRDEEEEEQRPVVSIPKDSSVSPFSPNGGGDDMSPFTRESQQSPVIPGANGCLDESQTARVIATMNEYFLNDLLDEAVDVMKESVHPNAGGEAVRILIKAVLEKKDSERKKFNVFLPALYTSGLLTKNQCVLGISSFLDDFDDIVVDVPLVADYVASILSALYLVSAIDDLSFSLHLPEENNYSYSSNQYSLIVKTATFIQRASDEATAKKFFTASLEGRNVSELDDMNREQVERAIEKNQAAYLV